MSGAEEAFRAGWIARGDYGVDRDDYAEFIADELAAWQRTTPLQRLDAATVERDEATTEAIRRLQFKADFQRGYGADWFSLDRADADLILAALATDPHQHGGKRA